MPAKPLKIAVLAAGQGKRMHSDLPKVLHPVAGRPMVGYVIDAARSLDPSRLVVVVGYQADQVRSYLGPEVSYAVQERQLGTGHALLAARSALGDDEEADLVLLYGDLPLVTGPTLAALVAEHRRQGAAATVLTATVADPQGYGRIVRGSAGTGPISRIVEEADATPVERAIHEINTGIYCFRLPLVFPYLEALTGDNRQGELYLVDVIALLLQDGHPVATLTAPDPAEVEGVNSRRQLARAEQVRREELVGRLMDGGVTVLDPATTYVDWGVSVGHDTVIEPGSVLRGRTRVGTGCHLGPWAYLVDAEVGAGCRVWASVVEGSRVGDGASVGPYSRLRPGTVIGSRARVGNFAELKNTQVGERAKVQHHSYVGDADIGPDVNIGAGTVVVNYDGQKKHRTVIGSAAFIGCNSNLVAPVEVGAGAYTAAGSTVVQDVPPGHLAVARTRQRNIAGWVQRRRPGTASATAAGDSGDDRANDGDGDGGRQEPDREPSQNR